MVEKKEYFLKSGAVIINPGCTNSCFFCEGKKNIELKDIKRQEINILKNIIEFKKKRINSIEISGSDPIEYDKIINLIKYLNEIGFKVQLSTHGRNLSDKVFLDKLIKTGIHKLRIPLYGTTKKIHDSIAGKGSFQETYNGILNLLNKKTNIKLQISNIICQNNKNNLIDFVNLMQNLKINDYYITFPCIFDQNYKKVLPAKDMSDYLIPVIKLAEEKNYPLKFYNIPFCVFKKYNRKFMKSSIPPDLGKNCQPIKEYKTNEKDLPSYRVKIFKDICKNCSVKGTEKFNFNLCYGFNKNEVNKFGIGDLKPI